MPKVWKIAPRLSDDVREHLLLSRGINTPELEKLYFHPTKDNYQSSWQIEGIAESKKIIESVIKEEKLIVVYGDYDVDGICSTAIAYLGLSQLGAKVLPYIPHRDKEGYGLSKLGIDWAKDQGAALIITVDTGIVALEQIEYIHQQGMRVIVTDHHVSLDTLPKADSIVHSTEMCGAGVIWCLLQSMLDQQSADQLLELVAIATVCDMMILKDINRWFVKQGVQQLRSTKRVGIQALANECAVILKDLTPYHIGHVFGPRINAIGRLEHSIDALRLICTNNPKKAVELAKLLTDTNTVKKQLTNDAISEAKVIVDQLLKDQTEQQKIIVVHSKNWVPGIIGLVASRLADEYHIPTIVISEGESQSKASARSLQGINIVETIRKCADLLIDVGGHPAAAGFTIANENIAKFKERINTAIDEIKEHYVDEVAIEYELSASQVNQRLVTQLEDFEPFGLGNEKPLFACRNMMINDIKTVGEGKHLKFKANNVDVIAFSKGDLAGLLNPGQTLDLAFHLEINKFNGRETLQLNVVDLLLD